jgi:lipopolysaccharide export system protein LptC
MTTFDAQEKPDYHIDMPNAVLNLQTRVIVSDTRTNIKRADFEIAGDAMEFSTLTHQGTLTGHVHMTIYNQSELSGKPKK